MFPFPSLAESSDNAKIESIESVLHKAGFVNLRKIGDTLQGGIWQGNQSRLNYKTMIIKVTDKHLHQHSISLRTGNKTYRLHENILIEQAILEYLSKQNDIPKSIVKYVNFLESHHHYYLVEENGGRPLFDFILKGHKLIINDNLDICEWHKMVKVIFKQMIECVEYIHSKHVCHFDISLENFLINDVLIQETKDKESQTAKIAFILSGVQLKLCDFGLSEYFDDDSFLSNKFCGKLNYQSPEISSKKSFNAKSNDLFCLGVCLWMLTLGLSPWKRADKKDKCFVYIMSGHIEDIINKWNKTDYVDEQWIDLMQRIFQYQDTRIDLQGIKSHSWLKS